MLNEKLLVALNEQMKKEFYSSFLYLSMAGYFEEMGLSGFAKWMRAQEQEERGHGLKIFDYIVQRNGRVVIKEIDAPPTEWDNPTQAFRETLAHEKEVTAKINHLMDMAITEKDYATVSFLKWFIDEQVEEEFSVQEILDKLKLAADSPGGLFILDKDLGA